MQFVNVYDAIERQTLPLRRLFGVFCESRNWSFSHVRILNNILLQHFMMFYSLLCSAFFQITGKSFHTTPPSQPVFILILPSYSCFFWLIASSCLSTDFLLLFLNHFVVLSLLPLVSHGRARAQWKRNSNMKHQRNVIKVADLHNEPTNNINWNRWGPRENSTHQTQFQKFSNLWVLRLRMTNSFLIVHVFGST